MNFTLDDGNASTGTSSSISLNEVQYVLDTFSKTIDFSLKKYSDKSGIGNTTGNKLVSSKYLTSVTFDHGSKQLHFVFLPSNDQNVSISDYESDNVEFAVMDLVRIILFVHESQPPICYCESNASIQLGLLCERLNGLSLENNWSLITFVNNLINDVNMYKYDHVFWTNDVSSKQHQLNVYNRIQEYFKADENHIHGVDLFISFLYIASKNYRRNSIARPMPFAELLDYENLLHIIDNLPRLDQLAFESTSVLGLKLLQWVLSRKTQLVRHCTKVANGTTKIEYAINCFESPTFRQITSSKVEAYHGSSIENMYSIISNGLVSLSDTKFMKNGAAFGSGVYFSNSIKVAELFANSQSKVFLPLWRNSIIASSSSAPGNKFQCEAILTCSVFAGEKQTKTKEQDGDYFVIQNSEHTHITKVTLYMFPLPSLHRVSLAGVAKLLLVLFVLCCLYLLYSKHRMV